jgi:hypothetical protein
VYGIAGLFFVFLLLLSLSDLLLCKKNIKNVCTFVAQAIKSTFGVFKINIALKDLPVLKVLFDHTIY